ncbi:MAG: 2-hydroxyacyl-CoA dehydratase family protein [Oscillospiraceae bacterium]
MRLVVTGSEIDDPAFTKLIEDCGAMVVADRYCYGSLPGREQIEILDGETPLRAVARHYLRTSQCPRCHGARALRRPPHLHPRPVPRIQRRRRALRADEVLRVLEL